MDLSDAFGPDVTLESFFHDALPELYREYRDDLRELSEIDIIVCCRFEDSGEVYSVRFGRDDIAVEDEEMIDFPLFTLIGQARFWDEFKEHARGLVREAEERKEELAEGFRLTQSFYDEFERQDGVIDISLTETRDHPAITFQIVLNDYSAPDGAPQFHVTLPLTTLRDVTEGRVDPVKAAKNLDIRGDYRHAAFLGGMFMDHADR